MTAYYYKPDSSPASVPPVVLILLMMLCASVAFVLATQNLFMVVIAVLAAVLFLVGFMSPQVSLYILILSMLISPEFGTRDVSGQGFTLRFEDLLLIVMGGAWLAKSAVYKTVGLARHTRLNLPIIIYVLVCLLATGLGVIQGTVRHPMTGMLFVMKYIEYFFIFFITINNITSKKQLKQLLIVLFITYIIVLLNGFAQLPRGVRISAPFEGESGEPNTLGGYLLIMLSLNMVTLFTVKRFIHKLFFAFLGLACFIAILFTLSRATWIGLAAMYPFFLLFLKQKKTLIIILLLLSMTAPFLLPAAVINRALYTFGMDINELQSGGTQLSREEIQRRFDTSTEARFSSMNDVLKDIQKHPVFGYGITGYILIDAQYHRVLIETGIVGIAAFLFLLWSMWMSMWDIWRRYRGDPLYNIISIGTMCAFFGLLAHAIGTNTFIIVRIMEPFWCLLGLNMAIPIIEQESAATPAQTG